MGHMSFVPKCPLNFKTHCMLGIILPANNSLHFTLVLWLCCNTWHFDQASVAIILRCKYLKSSNPLMNSEVSEGKLRFRFCAHNHLLHCIVHAPHSGRVSASSPQNLNLTISQCFGIMLDSSHKLLMDFPHSSPWSPCSSQPVVRHCIKQRSRCVGPSHTDAAQHQSWAVFLLSLSSYCCWWNNLESEEFNLQIQWSQVETRK